MSRPDRHRPRAAEPSTGFFTPLRVALLLLLVVAVLVGLGLGFGVLAA